ncbi:MAG: protein kinase [Candidatus Polarisedimenticolaceae bacterium]|nr:protein kinase [Candidatus Polarisedimenticolaceae bacterium]
MSQRAERLELLFCQALQQAAKDRCDWLKKQCADEAMRNELLSLLDAHEQAGDFMDRPLQVDVDVDSVVDSELAGRQLGPYRIDSLIAYGGMGRIYRAHRNDGAYAQQVAIKLIESGNIDPALLRYERQILADLHHPNVVSLIDGGSLEEGVPYLVMEYIQGRPIDRYVREEQLSRHQTLRLFSSLARVVSQTHQHGVIHCDLKPDNILVTDEGDLKLLDFGVAHLYSMAAAEQVPLSRALTPEYASPQRHQDPRPRVSDDIYSLGVIFGVMLSGEHPGKPLAADGSGCVALSHIESHLGRERRAIFCKATHPDPQQRYQTVEEMNADIFRWFDREPLLAMGDRPGYRLRKFLRRYRLRLGVSAAVLALVISMFAIWHAQKQRADQAQSLAVAQVESVLRELDDRMERLSGSTLARVATIEEALKRLQQMGLQQPLNREVKRAVADANMKLGDLLGHPFRLHLNRFERSRAHLEQALAIYRELFAEEPESFPAAMQMAKAERILVALMVYLDRQPEKGLERLQQTLSVLQQLKRGTLLHNGQLAVQHLAIAHLLTRQRRLKEAAEIYRKVEVLLQHPNDSKGKYEQEHNLSVFHFFLDERAAFILASGDYSRAKTAFEGILQHSRGSLFWRDQRRHSRSHYALACIGLLNQEPVVQAADHLYQAREIVRSLIQEYPVATSLQWELMRYAPLEHAIPESNSAWIAAFDCHNAYRIMDPPMPPLSHEI